MNRSYYAQRRLGGHNPHGVGTVAIGTIVYIQDSRGTSIRRNPWIVLAWHNREYHPAVAGAPGTTYMAGGHLATVRSLRDGCEQRIADHILVGHDDAGLIASDGARQPIPVLPGREYRPAAAKPIRRRKAA